jgi:flagellar assembly factor FliW
MKIDTLRFGAIEADESRVITMKGCILGFDHLQHFTILLQDQNNPLWWLQSLEDGAVAFVVIDPFVIKQDYRPTISVADRTFLEISREEEISYLSIVTIRSQPFGVTANLRAPLVINSVKRLGSQIVLEEADYPIRYDVSSTELEERTDTGKVASL